MTKTMNSDSASSFIFLNSHPIQYFAPLYRYLTEKGVALEVLYCSGEAAAGKFDREFGQEVQWDIPLLEGYTHRFLKNRGIYPPSSKRFLSLVNVGIVGYLFRRKRATLVIHSWQYATDLLAIVFGKLAGHRLALWTEVNAAQEALQPAWKRLTKKIFFKFLFIFISEYWCIGTQNRRFYEGLGVPAKRLLATPYSVDNNRFSKAATAVSKQETRQQLGLPAEAFIILYAGKYIAKKRPMDLLAAFSGCRQPAAMLVMVGEGELRHEMEQFISHHAMKERVRLTGFINQSEIPLYYRAADLFVMCSGTGETWGLSVNEAMNFGLPLVVSSLSGCSADLVKPGVNGFVFHTGDTGNLAQCLNDFLEMPSRQLEDMGRESLKLIQQFSYEKILEGIGGGWDERCVSGLE